MQDKPYGSFCHLIKAMIYRSEHQVNDVLCVIHLIFCAIRVADDRQEVFVYEAVLLSRAEGLDINNGYPQLIEKVVYGLWN